MKTVNNIILVLFFVVSLQGVASAQEQLYGLWEITDVSVGGTNLTPLGKWSRIHADGRYETGNGWLQNGRGTYQYDPETREFLPFNPLGPKDEAGPFNVSFEDGKMIWERMEGDMLVRVISERIDQLPMTYADLLAGLWDFTSTARVDEDETDEGSPEYMYISWGGTYRGQDSNGEQFSGYWHSNPHKPELIMIPHDPEAPRLIWQVTVSTNELELFGLSEGNNGVVMRFRRTDTWPEAR